MQFILQLQNALSAMQIKDIVDISIITICVYFVLVFIKQTRSAFILGAFVSLFTLNFIAQKFDLSLTRQLFEPLLTLFIAIFVIVFQPEIRKFFKWISSGRMTPFTKALSLPENNIQTIVRAAFSMAKQKIGAIIVIPGEYPLDDLIEGGFPLNGKISYPLILSIFDSSTPGHDGAILIDGSEIKMFGLHLPLAREFTEYSRVGTRHRAGAGITERTDALSIIVSEERGEVSISLNGTLKKVKTPEELVEIIAKFTGDDATEKGPNKNIARQLFFKNKILKSIALLSGLIFWFFSVYEVGIVKTSYNLPIEYRYLSADLLITTTVPNTINVTVSGSNRDISNLKTDNIKIIVDASKFVVGDNTFSIDEKNVQNPSYIELNNFTPKTVKTRTVEKSANAN